MKWLSLCFVLFFACKSEKKIVPELPVKQSAPSAESKPTIQTKPVMAQKSFHTIDYLLGKFDPLSHQDFVVIPIEYADRAGQVMRKDAFEAFKKMHSAAAESGIKLVIKSATRNFNYQKGIWERKWTGARTLSDGTNAATDIDNDVARALKILEYSAMPGASRHHWGTDIDLNSFDNKWFEEGVGLKVYTWLKSNAANYGYCQVYCEKGAHRSTGYNEEKWHYSFMPESEGLLTFAKAELKNTDLKGFKGDHTAVEINIKQKYIMGINDACTNH